MNEKEESKASVISVLNMKGGVGKTTLTCNLAIELARKGYSVLVVDIDPQFNSTQTLIKYFTGNLELYSEISDNDFTIKNIFYNFGTPSVISQKNTVPISGQNEKIPNIFSLTKDGLSLDLIAGDLHLIVDINASSRDKFGAFFNTNDLRKQYNYILIDCPPTWGELTSVALSTSDYYLIPTTLDDFSTIGISILKDQLMTKIQALTPNTLHCLGVAYTFLTPTTAQDGIARRQKPIKQDVEKFFSEMSQDLKTDVEPFKTIFYRDNSFVGTSAIYKSNEKKPEFALKAIEFTEEVIDRTN